jgi:hypothetical protein
MRLTEENRLPLKGSLWAVAALLVFGDTGRSVPPRGGAVAARRAGRCVGNHGRHGPGSRSAGCMGLHPPHRRGRHRPLEPSEVGFIASLVVATLTLLSDAPSIAMGPPG